MFNCGVHDYDLYLLLFFWTLTASYMNTKEHLFVVPTLSSRWWLGVQQKLIFLEKHTTIYKKIRELRHTAFNILVLARCTWNWCTFHK
jgi:hypothetical protein